MANNYGKIWSQPVPQTEKLTENQVKNNAGGFVYSLSTLDTLKRWIFLGSESGTYYQSQKDITKGNLTNVLNAIKTNGVEVVKLVEEINTKALAPKVDTQLFVLAMAIKHGDLNTRRAAYAAIPKMCRIGTHLFMLMEFLKNVGKGESRGLRTALINWYTEKEPSSCAYQLVKYQQRNGWAHKDVLRLAHPSQVRLYKNNSPATINPVNELLHYVLHGWESIGEKAPTEKSLGLIWACEKAKKLDPTNRKDVNTLLQLITTYNMSWEMVPTTFLKEVSVWETLIDNNIPYTALLRNLGRLTANGTIKPLSDTTSKVVQLLKNQDKIVGSRVHPIAVLSGLRTYQSGRGIKGDLTWQPNQSIVAALDDAFYLAFKSVEKTGLNYLLALDISGSMHGGQVAGVPGLTPAEAEVALALVLMNVEDNVYVMGYGSTLHPLNLNKKMTIKEAQDYIRGLNFGGTDCSLPMLYAMKNKLDVDCFINITDCETWRGRIHPSMALEDYRKTMGRNSKNIVIGMTGTSFTVADPNDKNSLDLCGFDASMPQLIAEFAKGSF
jgi:60 kDa SS-A/Ro ribonucleoprotein